jgi:alcohol dehydrogenase class IV
MNNQSILGWESVQDLDRQDTYVWTLPSLLNLVSESLPRLTVSCDEPPVGVRKLVVVGGGQLIDNAKFWRRDRSPATWLCAVPSLWGSGAEASPVAVRTVDGKKDAQVDQSLLPDARAVLPGLVFSIPAERARWGMGDAWSHALEGFLSPLATADVRAQCADLIKNELLSAQLKSGPEWFELSARACSLQARSGVGLIHAIAHVLEPRLQNFGHARLCSLFLWPVFKFNIERGPKVGQLLGQFAIDSAQLAQTFQQLFSADEYREVVPALRAHWSEIIRHPLARINSTLVRADAITWFDEVVQ